VAVKFLIVCHSPETVEPPPDIAGPPLSQATLGVDVPLNTFFLLGVAESCALSPARKMARELSGAAQELIVVRFGLPSKRKLPLEYDPKFRDVSAE
jgi:hypothetical protein